MLKINDLSITTSKGRRLLEGFSFVLNDGDKVALIGEEGNGKSTILKILADEPVDSYVTYSGTIDRIGKIAYLPQSIQEECLDLLIPDFISEELDYNHLYTLIARTGIDPDLICDRKVRTLSGGEKVKIALLKVLYDDPDILLLDEPTNDLDLRTLIWLEEFIKNSDKGMIFISHDEALLENCANGILHLEQLKRKSEPHITYSGTSYRDYVENRDAFISRNNMIAAKEKAQLNKQLEKWRQIYQKVEHRQSTISRANPHGGQLLKKKMRAVKSQARNLEAKKESMRKVYEPEEAIDIFFEDVQMNPDKIILDLHLDELKAGDSLLARNIDLLVRGKDKVCIIADNGMGKSTLIRIIAAMLREREDIRTGYMPQDYYEVMDPSETPISFLWDGRKIEEKGKIGQYLGALKFTSEEMEHRIDDLSQGQKCKILLVKMILDGCNVLVLDEPTRNLSPLSNPRIREILNEFKGTIISVSHDRKFIEEVAEKVYELDRDGLRLLE